MIPVHVSMGSIKLNAKEVADLYRYGNIIAAKGGVNPLKEYLSENGTVCRREIANDN